MYRLTQEDISPEEAVRIVKRCMNGTKLDLACSRLTDTHLLSIYRNLLKIPQQVSEKIRSLGLDCNLLEGTTLEFLAYLHLFPPNLKVELEENHWLKPQYANRYKQGGWSALSDYLKRNG